MGTLERTQVDPSIDNTVVFFGIPVPSAISPTVNPVVEFNALIVELVVPQVPVVSKWAVTEDFSKNPLSIY